MTTRHHVRNGSCGRKLLQQQQQHNNRSNRPAPLSRRTTNNGNSHSQLSPTLSSPSGPRTLSKGVEVEIIQQTELDDDDNDIMASFLQFCPTCERQILVPTISVLYCSEACRRRDSAKSIPQQLHYSPPLSPYTSAMHDYPPTTIVPRRSPTVLRPLSTTFSELSLYELGSSRVHTLDDVDESTFGMPVQSTRPYIDRNNSSDDSTQLPSLVHSPASSFGAAASHLESRPLPRKHSCPTSKGIDLVTPISAAGSVSQALPGTYEARRSSAPSKTVRGSISRS